ncbi:MAG: hypothetical protein R3335_08530 [Anaerolineales bacterium]|nr:hypothetical protein [Anaerolineales bacterium]
MSRLSATMGVDIRLQVRQGFYYAAAFAVVVLVVVINQLPQENIAWAMPILISGNLLINAFYFIGGLVLLEKSEGSLEAQVVTPLRTGEYLASKTLTLSLLSLFESLIIVALTVGADVRWASLAAGVVLMAAMMALIGFVAVSRYDSINEFLFPSIVYVLFLSLPMALYLGFWEIPLIYLHPLQAPLVLMKDAFGVGQIATWELVYGAGYSALWIGLMYAWSKRAFVRFVIRKEGT